MSLIRTCIFQTENNMTSGWNCLPGNIPIYPSIMPFWMFISSIIIIILWVWFFFPKLRKGKEDE